VAASARLDLDGAKDVGKVLEELAALPRARAAFVAIRPDGATLVESERVRLDTELVDELPLEGVRYTVDAGEAEQAVLAGDAAAAFIVRPPTVEQVESFALAGERMPEKSTYFYPKLVGGLLFSPFDE
jgi:hypothetical protein